MDEDFNEEIAEQADMTEDLQEAQLDGLEASYPQMKKEDSLYTLFWKVVRAHDSTKVANLNNTELGSPWMPVRGSKHLALLSSVFHHQKLAGFFQLSAEDVNATSMARAGWLGELFVSQKKFSSKTKAKQGLNSPQSKGWGIFRKKPTTTANQET